MAPEHQSTFGPFRLEGTPGRLWRGGGASLRPRSLAMLRLWPRTADGDQCRGAAGVGGHACHR